MAGVGGESLTSGWADSREADTHGLTSVHQSLHDQGAQCAMLALGQSDNAAEAPWSLSIRSTTRRAAPV
jgi:hypothetical protein